MSQKYEQTEDKDVRAPWKRGWDDCGQGVSSPPYPPEDRASVEEWLEGWREARECGWYQPDVVNFHLGMEARFLGQPRDESKGEHWLAGWDNEGQTHTMRSARARRDAACLDEPMVAGELAFLGRAFLAGNRSALLAAMKLCEEKCFPPPSWMVQATAFLISEVRAETIEYRGRVRDLTRFLAVESLRCRNSPKQWQALTGPGVSLGELAEWLVGEGWESDPGYSQAIAIATQMVQRLGDNIDTQSVQKCHGKVKRDIEMSGADSSYIRGIDVAEILRILKADDLLAEAEVAVYDHDFIPFRTDILG